MIALSTNLGNVPWHGQALGVMFFRVTANANLFAGETCFFFILAENVNVGESSS